MNFRVKRVDRSRVRGFIEEWHYSGSINGLKSDYCFGLFDEGKLIGAMMYGLLGMADVWKSYVDNKKDLLELRRLCTIDSTPTNTESYFIGNTLKWLQKYSLAKKIISYADPNFGHDGTIYKATNFDYLGKTAKGRVIIYNGERYHDKTIRTKYNGELKPFAKEVKQALENGDAYYEETEGKHIYMYNLHEHRSKRLRDEIEKRSKRVQQIESEIDKWTQFDGVGGKTASMIYNDLGSISSANLDKLESVSGIGPKTAESIRKADNNE